MLPSWSVAELWLKAMWWAILMAKLAMRMRRVTWLGCRSHPKRHIWNQWLQFTYSLYNFYGATMMINGSLHGSTPIVKQFSAENFVPSKASPKMVVFRELQGLNVTFCFLTPKRHLVWNRVVWHITRENRFRGLGCRSLEVPGKKKPSKHLWCAISRIRGKILEGSWLNFTCG